MNRLPWLDALRGVAVLLVLGRHLPLRVFDEPHGWLAPFHLWKQAGWAGVDLFFVISGFLVSGLLYKDYQRNGSVDLGRFFMRRSIRIIAPFYAFLILSAPFHLQFFHWVNVLCEVFFLQSYLHTLTVWGHTWSLAVEEHFYILFGVLIFFLSRQGDQKNPFRMLFFIWLLLALGCLIMRMGTPYDSYAVLFNSHMRFDGLFFGAVISYAYHFHFETLKQNAHRFRFVLALFALLLIGPIFIYPLGSGPGMSRFGLTGLYLGFGGILLLCLFKTSQPPKYLIAIGRISYSVYLWHVAAYEASLHLWYSPDFTAERIGLACGTYILLALGAGWLFYRYVERPSLVWRDRAFPMR